VYQINIFIIMRSDMKNFPNKSKGFRWGLLSLMVLMVFALPNLAYAQEESGETGNVCVQDFQGGAVCTANDVRIEEMTFVRLIEPCNQGTIGYLTAEFRMLISAEGSPDRYDIGVFVDLSGSPEGALAGDSCYHGYLSPPITTTVTYGDLNNDVIRDIVGGDNYTEAFSGWWNGELGDSNDMCGDLEDNTQAFNFLIPLTMRCVDNSLDGAVDVHVCTSWDNNSNTTCTGVSNAFPGTNSKCSCDTIELPFSPTKIDMIAFEANSSNNQDNSMLIVASLSSIGLLLTAGLLFQIRLFKKNKNPHKY
jgi:hypothetical protein